MTGAREAVRRLLGAEPVQVAGGVATLDDGRQVMAKRGAGPGANAAEAAGLRWLATGDVPVPEVYGHDETWLLMRYVPSAGPTPDAARAFGHGLAALHLRGAPAFGSPPPDGPADAWIGLTGMANIEEPDWPTFYAAHRVEPYLREATDSVCSTRPGPASSARCVSASGSWRDRPSRRRGCTATRGAATCIGRPTGCG